MTVLRFNKNHQNKFAFMRLLEELMVEIRGIPHLAKKTNENPEIPAAREIGDVGHPSLVADKRLETSWLRRRAGCR